MQQVAEMRWRGLTQYRISGSRGEAQDSLSLTKSKYFIITELFNHINMQNRQGYAMFVSNCQSIL